MVVFDVLLLFGGIGALIFLIVRKITVSRERKEAEVRRVQLLQQEANKREEEKQELHATHFLKYIEDPKTKRVAIDIYEAIRGTLAEEATHSGFVGSRTSIRIYLHSEYDESYSIHLYGCRNDKPMIKRSFSHYGIEAFAHFPAFVEAVSLFLIANTKLDVQIEKENEHDFFLEIDLTPLRPLRERQVF